MAGKVSRDAQPSLNDRTIMLTSGSEDTAYIWPERSGVMLTSTRPTSGWPRRLKAAAARSILRPCRTRRRAGPRSVIVTTTLGGGQLSEGADFRVTRTLAPSG